MAYIWERRMNDFAEQAQQAREDSELIAREAVAWAIALGARGDFDTMKTRVAGMIEGMLLEHYRAGVRGGPERTLHRPDPR